MASTASVVAADWSAFLPEVYLEVRQGTGRATTYALSEVDFLIGTLPGCDLRVGGAEPATVLCLLARHPTGVSLRRLSPTQTILVNGRSVAHVELAHDDLVQIGLVEIRLRMTMPQQSTAELAQARHELQERVGEFRAQLVQFQQEKETLEQDRQQFSQQRSLLDGERDLAAKLKHYDDDVLRLNRWQGTLEERERAAQQLLEELNRNRAQLQLDSAEMEAQLLQIDECRASLNDETERLAAQKQEQDRRGRELAERTAACEGQQTTLTALRSRLERMREEVRTGQQRLDEQQARQDARETDLTRKTQEMHKLQLDLESQKREYEQDRQQWLQRSAVLETAVRQLKQAQENLAGEQERVRRTAEELDKGKQELLAADGILKGRLTQLAEAQERLDLERASLRERSVNLLQREQACEALQEQLRRRGEEISLRHKETLDQGQQHQAKLAGIEEERRQLLEREQQHEAVKLDLEQRAATLQEQQALQAGFESRYQELLDQVAAQRKMFVDEQTQFRLEQHMALEKLAQQRAEFDALRVEAQTLIQQLPDVELRAGTALDRLSHARTQLREHLTEIHRYVRQCQDELERVRGRLQADFDKLQQEEQTLRRGQDEQRLAMVAFRQQLIDWQGQIAELKRLLSRDETRLERKQALVDERAAAMVVESERLARQAEELDQQERDVADRRQEIDSHLVEMREWYRHKLRELAGIPLTTAALAAALEPPPVAEAESAEDNDSALVPTGRSILSITGPVDAGDRKLGQVLREAQLIDADTLTALLAAARRQRRSLRQVLLTSGVITLYQLALIEAGNTPGLMLGPVRIIDRLRQATHETVYRVFDPRHGTEAVLRHLAEADMTDATRPDEFRQRFTQAMLNDPHLANTLEVFDLLGRPAALQEWLSGLPATDWPPLTAAPGVCYRLLTQAAQGLATAHRAGIVHGHLSDSHLLLNGDGVLKMTGLGEPPWLIGLQHDEEPTPHDDLRTLGKIVSGWCTPTGVRKGAKTRPLPDALISVLYRLAADGDAGYRDVQELLADLEKAAGDIPPNAEAWDRLLKYVREHGAAEALVRQSA